MNICIFDTETTSLEKPFCYNIGYIIVNADTYCIGDEPIVKREFVVEQVWHNNMLFTTAYYAEKREEYIRNMRARTVKLDKFGYVTQQMARDFKNYEVEYAFAYNSSFDEKVFNFNCDWFKCINPFDNIPIYDIRGMVHEFIADTQDYRDFCDKYSFYTDSGNYSTTAEVVFRYISNLPDFVEEHTALEDAQIETDILTYCVCHGADVTKQYKARQSIVRELPKQFRVIENGEVIFETTCQSMRYYKKENMVRLKSAIKNRRK